jgi:hypothetical protein
MNSSKTFGLLAGLGFYAATTGFSAAHSVKDGEHHHHDHHGSETNFYVAQGDGDTRSDATLTTGQGEMKFKLIYNTSDLPEAANAGITRAHGGFAVDRRPGKGEAYWALPKVGILRVNSDLNKVEVLPTDMRMKQLTMHNATFWEGKGDHGYLVFPGVDGARIFTTNLDGTMVNTLNAPEKGFPFEENRVFKWFDKPDAFIPTDVEYHNGKYYITTGYSQLDWVLIADVKDKKKFSTEWTPKAFGGKGNKPGKFGTGHGITNHPDGKSITVADRPKFELDRFTYKGEYLDTVNLPEGSLPCDIDYLDGYTIVGCLDGPKGKEYGAPIYILKDEEIVSTIQIKTDLKRPLFTHIHNAVMTKKDGKYYILAQAWNPGGFVILEQVE